MCVGEDATLRGTTDIASRTEKNRNRIEKRSASVTKEIRWLAGREEGNNAPTAFIFDILEK